MNKKTFKDASLRNEQKYVAYCMRNPNDSFSVSLETLLNPVLRNIVEGVQRLSGEGLVFSLDELLLILSEVDSSIKRDQVEAIYNSFEEFDNITYIKKKINQTYLKEEVNKRILSDILVNTDIAGELDLKKLKELANDLMYNLSAIDDKIKIKTANDLGEDYLDILDNRKKGVKKRSLGFKPLNQSVTRPASAGEMTGLLSLKGMAKSIFTKSINNILMNTGVPVLDLDLEMTQESSTDRFMAMRGNFSLTELLLKEKEEKMYNRLIRTVSQFKRNNNYLYFNEPGVTLDDIDSIIYKAKSMFRNNGVMTDEDDYMFVSIDLLEMVEEFSGKEGSQVKDPINKLHKIAKKHGVHIFFTLQANENKIRSMKFNNPEDLDYYKIGLEDVYGSDAYSGRARLMLSLIRPKHLKMLFFPDQIEEWQLEEDIINCRCIKQNDGSLFFHQYVFDSNFKIYPRLVE